MTIDKRKSGDQFRNLDEFGFPDPRWRLVVKMTPEGSFRPLTLEDHHALLCELTTAESVPPDVKLHFETARNLLLYSWHVYRFIPVAESHAYATVEMALKERARIENLRPGRGLARLLDVAVRHGWLRGDRFRQFRQIQQRLALARGEEPEAGPAGEAEAAQRFLYNLVELVPKLRNELAHGSSMLAPYGHGTLGFCCDIVNQLFEEPETTSETTDSGESAPSFPGQS